MVMQLKNKDTIMQQYGDAAEKAPEDGLLLGQTERYVEYDAAGRVVKGQDIKAHSRYEEDVHPNNHGALGGRGVSGVMPAVTRPSRIVTVQERLVW